MILEVVLLLLVDGVCIFFVVILICVFFVFCVWGRGLIVMFEFIWVWVVYMKFLVFNIYEYDKARANH